MASSSSTPSGRSSTKPVMCSLLYLLLSFAPLATRLAVDTLLLPEPPAAAMLTLVLLRRLQDEQEHTQWEINKGQMCGERSTHWDPCRCTGRGASPALPEARYIVTTNCQTHLMIALSMSLVFFILTM